MSPYQPGQPADQPESGPPHPDGAPQQPGPHPPQQPAASPYAYPYYPPQAPYYAPHASYGYYAQPQGSQQALWSMILGIASIASIVVAICFYVPGIALGIPAIILSFTARKEIARSNGLRTGSGQATAGLVTGIIGIVLNVLLIAFFIVLFATEGFGSGSWDTY
ncbi:MAG: DUF4190 domain-containing protein [Aeromicrobium sp.]|uniref:DUF4190 domain-containing protein n=1 Tax=Aeromicrobium sp. TaxID=1871063 RepID=UPI0025C6DBEF|nr:DUF4190 domain-containing protein [Aeromicrobium sp.]MDF1703395.1 DUF4190 domain-containing protein [Aeromicrobium sp.]